MVKALGMHIYIFSGTIPCCLDMHPENSTEVPSENALVCGGHYPVLLLAKITDLSSSDLLMTKMSPMPRKILTSGPLVDESFIGLGSVLLTK